MNLQGGRLEATTFLHSQCWCSPQGQLICWFTLWWGRSWALSSSSSCQTTSFNLSKSWQGLCGALWTRTPASSSAVHPHQVSWRAGGAEGQLWLPVCPLNYSSPCEFLFTLPSPLSIHLSFPTASSAEVRTSRRHRGNCLAWTFSPVLRVTWDQMLIINTLFDIRQSGSASLRNPKW